MMSRCGSGLLESLVLLVFVFMAVAVKGVQGGSPTSGRLVNVLTALTVLTTVQVQGSQLTNRWDLFSVQSVSQSVIMYVVVFIACQVEWS